MQMTGTLRIRSTAGEAGLLERLEQEIARVQTLSDEAIESMTTLIDAHGPIDVARKLQRFTLALASPGAVLGRLFAREPDALPGFCLSLAAYRGYMDRLASGATPAQAAGAVEHERRTWLARALREHDIPASGMAPNPPHRDQPHHDEDDDDNYGYEIVDVYDAENEIDPGAVRAEVDRLLRRLQVDPERIEITVLPDDGLGRPGDPDIEEDE